MPLALTNHNPAAAPDAARWVHYKQAAGLLDVSEGHCRRMCTEWARDGLAQKFGGQWFVDSRADSRLRDKPNLAQRDLEQLAELDGEGIKPKYLEIAKTRRECLKGFDAFRLVHSSLDSRTCRIHYLAARAAEGKDAPSVTQFYEWQRYYEADGLRGLVPAFAFRDDSSAGAVGVSALTYIENLVYGGNQIKIATALTIAQGEALKHAGDPHWNIGSYRAVLLAIQKRTSKALTTFANKGERAAMAGCAPKIQRDFDSIAAGEEYCGDVKTLDIWCRVLTPRGWKAIRQIKISVWLDTRSRMVVGCIIRPWADNTSILAGVKQSIRAFGKPRILRTDNGKDFVKAAKHGTYENAEGQRVGSILAEMGIEVRRVAPYSPWAKLIESFFKTFKEHCDKMWASFWGGCPSERHEDRQQWVKENLEKIPTLDELEKFIRSWIETYHITPHSAVDMFGKSPLAAMEAFRTEPARMESDKVLNHLFRIFSDPKMVHRDGIKHGGRLYGHGDHRLVPMVGKNKPRVLLGIQPDDASRAMVCELDKTPLFEVECISFRGLDRKQAQQMVRNNRRLMLPYRQQARDARAFLTAMSPQELLDNRRRGIIAQHGEPPDSANAPPQRQLRIRPAMEDAIDAAGPAPSDVPSESIRTGTDDVEITLEDMIANEPLPAYAPQPVEDPDDDAISWSDMTGV